MPAISIVLISFVYFFLQGYAFRALKGKWRPAAWAPASAMLTFLAYNAIVIFFGSTAVLIPLQITLIVCLLWISVLLLVNLRGKSKAQEPVMQQQDEETRREEILGRI